MERKSSEIAEAEAELAKMSSEGFGTTRSWNWIRSSKDAHVYLDELLRSARSLQAKAPAASAAWWRVTLELSVPLRLRVPYRGGGEGTGHTTAMRSAADVAGFSFGGVCRYG